MHATSSQELNLINSLREPPPFLFNATTGQLRNGRLFRLVKCGCIRSEQEVKQLNKGDKIYCTRHKDSSAVKENPKITSIVATWQEQLNKVGVTWEKPGINTTSLLSPVRAKRAKPDSSEDNPLSSSTSTVSYSNHTASSDSSSTHNPHLSIASSESWTPKPQLPIASSSSSTPKPQLPIASSSSSTPKPPPPIERESAPRPPIIPPRTKCKARKAAAKHVSREDTSSEAVEIEKPTLLQKTPPKRRKLEKYAFTYEDFFN